MDLFPYLLHLSDNALLLAQRNAEWTGHGPVLEQDIAITNIALDGLGQARMGYQYAAALYEGMDPAAQAAVGAWLPEPWKAYGRPLQEDDLAFLRTERQFCNVLLAELPRGDWAFTTLRQFLFSAWQQEVYAALKAGPNEPLAAIAAKSLKEVTYHLRWSAEWVIRLGDGTEESARRMAAAGEALWPYTGEWFRPAPYETALAAGGIIPDPATLHSAWESRVRAVFEEARLSLPASAPFQEGGKTGRHTEHMGYLLAEMQYLQRAHPNAAW
jgi:ring-1,2-phenylacetyl-CoA epoxidase subunit PaaC